MLKNFKILNKKPIQKCGSIQEIDQKYEPKFAIENFSMTKKCEKNL
jgi:hypothetical protein